MATNKTYSAGFGGGCHWCTEAVFKAVKGVSEVRQGWIASVPPNEAYSEAVVVTYDPGLVSLKTLCLIHLHTHSSTSKHSMRNKYRSAVYYFNEGDAKNIKTALNDLQPSFENDLITEVLPFVSFKPSAENYQDYYKKNPEKPFCKIYIAPKLDRVKKLVP